MEGRVAVAKRTSQRGLAQGIMSEASRNGSLNRRDIGQRPKRPKRSKRELTSSQKEMVSEITDSWWNRVKVDGKAWQLVARLSLWRTARLFFHRWHHQHHQHHRLGNPDETCVTLCKAFHTIPRILKILEELNSYSRVKLKFMLV